MQKIFSCIMLLCMAAIQSCNNNHSQKDAQMAQASFWYQQQCHYSPLNSDSVLRYALLIDSVAKDLPPVYKAMALVGKGRYNAGSKPDLSFKLYEQALALLQGSGADSIIARAYNGMGVWYLKKSDYSMALDHYFKALRLFEQADDAAGLGGVLANIGEVYQVKNDIPSAKKYILRSMDISKKSNHMSSYLDAAQTLANIYGMNNQFDSAMAIDRMGIAASDSMGSTKLKSTFYNNLGNCYMYSNRPDSARYYFTQCVALDSANGILHYMVDNYLTLGQLSLQQKQLGEAEQYFQRAIKLSDSVSEKQLKFHAWKALSTLYKQQNNLVMAITAKDSAAAVKDRMINEKSENKIAELQELYETEKKEQTIALQQVKLSRQKLLLTGSVILLASLTLSGWLLYRRYKIKKEKELQATLLQQREKAILDILQAEDQERRRIAAELHDGVGQVMLAAWMNLQAIEPQMNSLDPSQQQALSKAIDMVGEGCKEVREVSHSMMPNALLNKGLVGAVRDFTQQIDSKVLSISLHTEGMNENMDDMVESILYRVIQESVNNAIKHAGANELDISLHNNAEGISLLVEDNGKGFDAATALAGQGKGLGLQNIKSRIAFLQGTVEWDSSPGNGTVVTIFIPAKKQYA
ncbi:MAG: tetratricopeptide repeat protein [Sphingobacteriales bacterium]|nr:MAG: tetratricopeptide repeat protein [Sphingobacteriales bacterium]